MLHIVTEEVVLLIIFFATIIQSCKIWKESKESLPDNTKMHLLLMEWELFIIVIILLYSKGVNVSIGLLSAGT